MPRLEFCVHTFLCLLNEELMSSEQFASDAEKANPD